jgi:hypothetical protein
MKITCLLLLLTISTASKAQSAKDTVTRFVYWGVGYQYQSFSHLSDRVGTRPEYQKPGSSMANLLIGMNKEIKGFVQDVQFHFASITRGDDERKSTDVINAGLALTFGYNFSKKNNFRFYPFVGVTGEFYQTSFKKDVSAISFDSILVSNAAQQRTEPTQFTNAFFCYQGGLAVDFISTKFRLLHSLGLRASYTGGFKSRSWRVNDNQLISGAPSDNVSQFNISLLLGVGGRRSGSMRF